MLHEPIVPSPSSTHMRVSGVPVAMMTRERLEELFVRACDIVACQRESCDEAIQKAASLARLANQPDLADAIAALRLTYGTTDRPSLPSVDRSVDYGVAIMRALDAAPDGRLRTTDLRVRVLGQGPMPQAYIRALRKLHADGDIRPRQHGQRRVYELTRRMRPAVVSLTA